MAVVLAQAGILIWHGGHPVEGRDPGARSRPTPGPPREYDRSSAGLAKTGGTNGLARTGWQERDNRDATITAEAAAGVRSYESLAPRCKGANSAISFRNASPYFASFIAPTPGIRANSSNELTRRCDISRNVAS